MNLSQINLFKLYNQESTESGIPIIFMAIASGLANSFILGIITVAADTASYDNLNFRYFLLFSIAFLIFIIGKRYSLTKATIIAENIIRKVRIRISEKIVNSELYLIENIGKGKIFTRLTQNTNTISQAITILLNALQAGITLVFCIFYMLIISKLAFFLTIFTLGIAFLIYLYHEKSIENNLEESINMENVFFDMLNDTLDGFKELKINKKKSNHHLENLNQVAIDTEQIKIKTGIQFVVDLMFSQTSFYILLAIVTFLLPRLGHIDSELVIRIAAAVLFIIGPLNNLVGAVPDFVKANVAIGVLYQLEKQFDDASKSYKTNVSVRKFTSFNKIQFDQTVFYYPDNEGNQLFTIGPFDLTINQGELIFVVGGNGSGKSTFLKLLTGLYYPTSGVITLDDLILKNKSYPPYRELFSIIFSDFHLFKTLYGYKESVDYDQIYELLKLMKLDLKTEIVDGKISNINLSTGQRKRLAMVVSLLDDKPICVYDEWAADQDPDFRKYFYDILLKDLQDRGKTIIAVSHDDRYFHVADRVLKMEFGKFC
jgi:putative ATP-binding cassette transporter